ncbi:C10 family peptidase [Robertkochia solimangrovi]|uniref:C10 family peptidase n=1 Tax=Robertkochia solimangrovi TaxID=2213046 RepID=UPI00117FF5F2|nr:C10 family peptidase [Robertkochia solimangrovi]TRZ42480.1 hypothetical protein DMZ48_13320 [Robertkochia solimangrovi]
MKKNNLLLKKCIFYIFTFLFFYSCTKEDSSKIENLQSNPYNVNHEMAIKVAENIILTNNAKNPLQNKSNNENDYEITSVPDEEGNILFYIINYHYGGWIILAADNRISPILAYSDKNEFRTDANEYSTGLIEWLGNTKNKIKTIRLKNLEQPEYVKSEWSKLESPQNLNDYFKRENNLNKSDTNYKEDPVDPNECYDEFEQRGPLLTTEWGQRCGFNDLLPTLSCADACYSNDKVFAGCVPIAIAQVLKYHNYPTTFNWSNMPDLYATSSTAGLLKNIHDNISDISYDCDGTGVDKDYNTANFLKNHFGYTSANQSSYNYNTVEQQLRYNRPVILGGGRDAGWWIFHSYADGHMWVCDGFRRSKTCIFDDNGDLITAVSYLYFHMNWGWSGNENGWYGFNNFDPGNYTFNYDVKMIYNIIP